MAKTRIVLSCVCDTERCLLVHLLDGEGFEVCEVDCAADMSDAMATGKVELILLDTLVAHTAALAMLASLKSHPQTRLIPVLVLGDVRQADESLRFGPAQGIDWFSRKGFHIESFIRKIRGILDANRSRRPVQAESRHQAGPATHHQLERLTEPRVAEVLGNDPPSAAFEFTITDAATTSCSRDGANEHIAALVERDPLLSVALLSWANRLPAENPSAITTIRDAVSRVGERQFYRLSESLCPIRFNNASLWDQGFFWMQSVTTSRLAALLSRQLGLGVPEEAASAGALASVGNYLLANYFPEHYGALVSSSWESASLSPAWEEQLVGTHHGRLAAWVLRHFNLPKNLQESIELHHQSDTAGRCVAGSAKLLAMIVQMAEQLAESLFPGDPPLATLAPLPDLAESVMDRSGMRPDRFLEQARNLVADTLTEMVYLFPQSQSRSYYYRKRPLPEVLYYVAGRPLFDVVKVFVETRTCTLHSVNQVRSIPRDATPLVVNLTRVREVAALVESVSLLLASGVLSDRRVVVLLNQNPPNACEGLVPDTCQLVAAPSHPACWFKWLTGQRETCGRPQLQEAHA